jgi:hypothetical protein
MERFNEIKHTINKNSTLNSSEKEHVVTLLNELKEEAKNLDNTVQERVISSTQLSTEKALEPQVKKEDLELSLKSLTKSVEDFEVSHPRLVKIVNSISVALANIGI